VKINPQYENDSEELKELTQYFLGFSEDNYEDARNAALGEMEADQRDRDGED
jgi:hypothetical protein